MDDRDKKVFDAILNNSELMIIGLGVDGLVSIFNPVMERLTGYPKEDVIGKKKWDFFVPSRFKEVMHRRFEAFRAGKEGASFECPQRTRDGGEIDVSWNTVIIEDDEGRPELAVGFGVDISEREMARGELARSEEHFRLLVENALDLITVLEEDGTIRYVGPSVSRILGYDPGELAGRNIFEYINPEDMQASRDALAYAAGRPGVTKYHELRIRRKDGDWRLNEASAYNLLDHPAVRGMVLNSRDITERKRVEDALRKSESRYRSIFDNASDALLVFDREGFILEANPKACDTYGYTYGEFIGLSGRDIVHPEYYHLFQEFLETVGDEEIFHSESVDMRKDGTPFDVEVRGAMLDYKGESCLLAAISDITERKQVELALRESESRYRGIFDAATDAFIVFNREGFVVEANQSACETYGYTHSEFVGLTGSDIVHPEHLHLFEYALRDMEETGAFHSESVDMRKDGTPFDIEVSGVLLEFSGEKYILAVITDITDRKRAERLARVQRDLAIELSVTDDMSQALEVALDTILEASGMDCGGIYVLHERSGGFDLIHHRGLSQSFVDLVRHIPGDSPRSALFREKKTLFTTYERYPVPKEGVREKEGIRAIALVPIVSEGEVIGSIQLGSLSLPEVPEASREMIEVMAGPIGQALARIRLVAALRESEERYRLLHDYAGESIFTYDRDLRMISINQRACEQIGYREEELLGKSVLELGILDSGDMEAVLENMRRLFAGDRYAREELRLIRRDGSVMIADVIAASLFDEQGEVIGITNIASDVTERKQAERLMRAQRDLALSISAVYNAEEAARICLDTTLEALGFDNGGVFLVDEESGIFELVYHRGVSEDFAQAVSSFDSESRSVLLIRDGQAVYINYRDLELDEIEDRTGEGIKAIAIVPLKHDEEIIGSMVVSSHFLEEIPEVSRDALDIMAGQVGQALARIRLVSALRKSEERYRLLHDHAGLAIFSYDRELNIVSVNPMVCEKIGYTEGELVGGNLLELGILHYDDYEKAMKGVSAVFGGQDVYTEELRLTHKDGRVMEAEITGTPLRNEEGEIVAIMDVVSDITDRKRAEEALKESAATYREIFNAANDAMFVHDGETGDIVDVNIKATEMLGYCAEELRDIEVGDFSSGEPPYTNEKALELIRKTSAGEPQLVEWRFKDKGGRRFWGEVSLKRAIIAGNERVLAVVRDVTDRKMGEEALKASEEELRVTFESTGTAMCVIEGDSTITRVNREFEYMTGYTKDEIEGNIRYEDIVYPEDLDTVKQHARELWGGDRKGPVTYEVRVVVKGGGIVDTLASVDFLPGTPRAVLSILDITERKRAERALRESEVYFRALIENSSDVITVINADGTIRYQSPSIERITGYSPEVYIGNDITLFFSLIHPDDVARVKEVFNQYMEGTYAGPYMEFRIKHKDGSWRFVEAVGSNLLDNPAVHGIISGWRDITDRKRAEEALLKSEERYRTTFESTGTSMGLIDRDGTITLANREFERLVGYTRQEVKGKKYYNFVHENDVDMVKRYAIELLRGETDSTVSYECRLVRKDGRILSVLTNVSMLPGMESSVVSIIDITGGKEAAEALRRSEEQYRTIFASTGTAMFLVGRDAVLLDANQEMEEIFGYDRDEVLGKKRYMEFLIPEDVMKVKESSLKLLNGEMEGPVRYEVRAKHKTGRVIHTLISVNMLPGMDMSVISIIDISDKKAYEDELEDRAEQLRDFLDIAAHELRHPATLLKGYASTLEKRGETISPETWAESLHAIDVGADRLVTVVEELLDVSRIERKHFPVNREEIELLPLLNRAVEEISAKEIDNHIGLDVAEGVGWVWADPERLLRLLIILLDNAMKYSPAGSEVSLQVRKKDGELLLSVMDRGIGIPDEDRDRIFERFFQVEDVLHHGGPGLGLGLYIGKRIVEAHGGMIWYEPRDGGGSTFHFTLPLDTT
ncbi:MAG: PAS domain S-box protein [Actinomycetota bacterium]|nr:PAS domain S-box protein [Actinomycetota bacterium]